MDATEDDEHFESDEPDSDEELQLAFERGELKPGLNAIIPFVKKDATNNVSGMKEKIKEFKINYTWLERLDLTNGPAPLSAELAAQYGDLDLKFNKKGQVSGEEKVDGAAHDFKREMLFYRQAQASVMEGITKLHKMGVATKRPEDYFAEMVKSDDHMKKVRENLVSKQVSIEKSDKAKKLRELKKMGKQIQQEVLKHRQEEKKEMMDKLKKIKKGKSESLEFLDTKKTPGIRKKNQKKNEYKKTKYGYGGQKKRGKYNTSESAADMSSFRKNKHGAKSTRSSSTKKPQRPGKSKRQNSRRKK